VKKRKTESWLLFNNRSTQAYEYSYSNTKLPAPRPSSGFALLLSLATRDLFVRAVLGSSVGRVRQVDLSSDRKWAGYWS
jgi:hypothetical protein